MRGFRREHRSLLGDASRLGQGNLVEIEPAWKIRTEQGEVVQATVSSISYPPLQLDDWVVFEERSGVTRIVERY